MIGKAEDADAPLASLSRQCWDWSPTESLHWDHLPPSFLEDMSWGWCWGAWEAVAPHIFLLDPSGTSFPFQEPLSGLHWSPVSCHELRVEYNFSIRSPVPLEKRWCADTEKSQAEVCVEAREEAAALEGLVWIFSKLKPNAEWKALVYSLVRRDKRQSGGRNPKGVLG